VNYYGYIVVMNVTVIVNII